VKAYVICIYFH